MLLLKKPICSTELDSDIHGSAKVNFLIWSPFLLSMVSSLDTHVILSLLKIASCIVVPTLTISFPVSVSHFCFPVFHTITRRQLSSTIMSISINPQSLKPLQYCGKEYIHTKYYTVRYLNTLPLAPSIFTGLIHSEMQLFFVFSLEEFSLLLPPLPPAFNISFSTKHLIFPFGY